MERLNGYKLLEERINRGLTLSEVAEKAGVTRQTISKWEKGEVKKANSHKLWRLAEVYGIEPIKLISLEA